MKRIVLACLLFAFVIAASSGALILQHRATDRLLTACDELIGLYKSGDYTATLDAAEAFPARLQEETRWFPFFLRHERIETVFQQAATLSMLVEQRDAPDFLATVSSIRMQLEILMEGEWPLPENIM